MEGEYRQERGEIPLYNVLPSPPYGGERELRVRGSQTTSSSAFDEAQLVTIRNLPIDEMLVVISY